MKKLAVVTGEAGFKSSTGKITPPLPHRGVSLKTLAELVGPLDAKMGVNAVAKDGYAITFSYDQLTKGTFIAYDPATGDELKNARRPDRHPRLRARGQAAARRQRWHAARGDHQPEDAIRSQTATGR